MSKFCLDTSAVEPLTTGRHPLSAALRQWFDQCERSCYISEITSFEMASGFFRLSMRKSVDDRLRARKIGVINRFFLLKMADRTIAINQDILDHAGKLRAIAERSYRDIGVCDAIIAATADLSGHALVTLNFRDLAATGVKCVQAAELARKYADPGLDLGFRYRSTRLPCARSVVVPRQQEVKPVVFQSSAPVPVVIMGLNRYVSPGRVSPEHADINCG